MQRLVSACATGALIALAVMLAGCPHPEEQDAKKRANDDEPIIIGDTHALPKDKKVDPVRYVWAKHFDAEHPDQPITLAGYSVTAVFLCAKPIGTTKYFALPDSTSFGPSNDSVRAAQTTVTWEGPKVTVRAAAHGGGSKDKHGLQLSAPVQQVDLPGGKKHTHASEDDDFRIVVLFCKSGMCGTQDACYNDVPANLSFPAPGPTGPTGAPKE